MNLVLLAQIQPPIALRVPTSQELSIILMVKTVFRAVLMKNGEEHQTTHVKIVQQAVLCALDPPQTNAQRVKPILLNIISKSIRRSVSLLVQEALMEIRHRIDAMLAISVV